MVNIKKTTTTTTIDSRGKTEGKKQTNKHDAKMSY